jgi:hypothetical protein
MKSEAFNSRIVESYFMFLKNLDVEVREALVVKLKKSLLAKVPKSSYQSLYGVWEDTRSAEEIIHDIRNARVNRIEPEGL